MNKYIVLALGLLSLTACDSLFEKDKEILTGKRESILLRDDSLAPLKGTVGNVSVPAPVNMKEWSQTGGNAEHLYIPALYEGHSADPVWTTRIGSGSNSDSRLLSGPVAQGGVVYAMDAGLQVKAVSAIDGDEKWAVDVAKPGHSASGLLGGGVAIDNGKVFVSSPMAEVLALNAKDGKILWRHATSSPCRAAPTVKNGRIYVITINNQLDVLSEKDGKLLWSHSGIMESAGVLGGASPAVSHDGVVIVPYSSGEVYALRAENGHPLWSESLTSSRRSDSVANLSHIRARPIIDKGIVYLISFSGRMMALDLRTGSQIWMRDLGGTRTPAVIGDYLFLVTNGNDVVCLDKKTGKPQWVKELQRHENPEDKATNLVWAGPLAVNDQLVFSGSNGQALFLSVKDGHVTRELPLPGSTTISPIIADKTMYFLTDNAELAAFR